MPSRTNTLIAVGGLQILLGVCMFLYYLWRSIRDWYSFGDHISELIVADALDLTKLDAYFVSKGLTPTGLNAEWIKMSPEGRPGGIDVIFEWMQPSNGWADLIFPILIAASGLTIVLLAASLGRRGKATTNPQPSPPTL